jgi:hypothetical protein
MRSSSRDAIKSAPEQARLPSRATYALQRHEEFDAFGHCQSSRRSQAPRVAGSAWSAASPPCTRGATCASTRPSKPPKLKNNSIGSHESWASFFTLPTHSVRSQRGSSNNWTCPTALAATHLRDPGRSPAHEPTGGASCEESNSEDVRRVNMGLIARYASRHGCALGRAIPCGRKLESARCPCESAYGGVAFGSRRAWFA